MELIKEDYSLGTQSANLTKIIKSESGLKIKIDIKSDSYDFQSFARVSVFNPSELKWNVISSIPFGNMSTPHKLFYSIQKNDNPAILSDKFKKDVEVLTKEAEEILDQKFSIDPVKVKKLKR
jgi:hypothetical protein